jgi:hypothetical protein
MTIVTGHHARSVCTIRTLVARNLEYVIAQPKIRGWSTGVTVNLTSVTSPVTSITKLPHEAHGEAVAAQPTAADCASIPEPPSSLPVRSAV